MFGAIFGRSKKRADRLIIATYFSGAQLANMVNEAALNAARYSKKNVSMADFETAKDTEAMKLQVKAWGQANGHGALLLDAWTAEGLARNPLK